MDYSQVHNASSTVKKTVTDPYVLGLIGSIFGIIHYGFDLIGWSLLIGYITANIVLTYIHDSIAHGYYTAKKGLGTFFDIISLYVWRLPPTAYALSPLLDWRMFHNLHHTQWLKDKKTDEHQWMVENNPIWIQLLIPNLKKYKHVTFTEQQKQQKLDEFKKDLNPLVNFVDDNWKLFSWVVHILFLLILGAELYIFLFLIPVMLSRIHGVWFGDIYPHIINEDPDNFLIYLINPAHFRHIHHHRTNTMAIDGKWRHFSVYYWFVKFFTNIHPKTKSRYLT